MTNHPYLDLLDYTMKYFPLLNLSTALFLAIISSGTVSANILPDKTLSKGYGYAIPDNYWGSDTKAHLSAAIHLSASQLDGASVSAVQFNMALQPGTIDGLVFIKKSLEREENLYEQPFDAVDGQNIVWLDFPFSSSGAEDLYIGYELTCTGNTIGYSWSDTSTPEGDYVRTGYGSWSHLSASTGHNSALTLAAVLTDGDFSNEVADGITLIQPDFPHISTAEKEYSLDLSVINTGVNTLKSFSVSIDNGTAIQTFDINEPLINNQISSFSIPYIPVFGEQTASIIATGNADTQSAASFNTTGYEKTYAKLPLVEIFTSQKCSNCPTGEAVLEKAIEQYGGEVIMVAHHAGFAADHFTIPESETFAEMIGANSAPLMSLDRKKGVTASSPSTVFHPAYASTELFSPYHMANTLIGIDVQKSEFNTPDSKMAVELMVDCDPSATLSESIRLHAFAVENKITDTQNDLGTTHKEWEHNHVIRGFLTPIEGVEIDINDIGNSVSLSSTVKEIEGSHSAPVNPDNLQLITFLTDQNGEVINCCTSQVELTNYSSAEIPEASTAWLTMDNNTITVTQTAILTDLCGRVVSVLTPSVPTILTSGYYIISSPGLTPQKLFIR